MSARSILLAALLLAAAGLAAWYGRSGSHAGPGGLAPAGPAPASESAKAAAALEAEAAGRKSAEDPPARPAAADAQGSASEMPQAIDPSRVAGGLDGGMPSDAGAAGDADPFEAKYANAKKSELQAAYDSLKVLYDENAEGRVQDRERALDPEALAELARELAWLKAKAFGGL